VGKASPLPRTLPEQDREQLLGTGMTAPGPTPADRWSGPLGVDRLALNI
jgi:hypothetical protein